MLPKTTPVLGVLPPPSGALELDVEWTRHVTPARDEIAIESFLRMHGIALPAASPLARWLDVLEEADRSHRNQTRFVYVDRRCRPAQGARSDRGAQAGVVSLRLYAPGRRTSIGASSPISSSPRT